MDSYLRRFVVTIALGLLPYPDAFRRRRVRAAARRLVGSERWPSDDQATGQDAAKLALLRLLWLQRLTRRAARHREAESAVLLARAAVETCILGIYCLHHPDAMQRMKAANIKAMGSTLSYLITDGILPQGLVDQALTALSTPGAASKTDLWQMTLFIEKVPAGKGAVSLYQRFYMPTSTFFVHASAPSLLRHVGPDDQLTDRPFVPWTRQSAVRISDACVGILAGAVADAMAVAPGEFQKYAGAHARRALTPVAVIAGRGFRNSVKLTQVPAQLRQMRDLHAYGRSEQALLDTPEARETRVRTEFERLAATVMDDSVPLNAYQPLLDYFVAEIVAEISERASLPGQET